jgi:hypothetical protein
VTELSAPATIPAMDDPDARFEAAEAIEQPLPQARPRRKPANPRAPYHQPLQPEHEDELALAIGQGLALIERGADEAPAAIVEAIARFIEAVAAGRRRLTRDPTDASFALGCAFGQQICRGLGFGWAHLRRNRSPGIVVVSADFRFVSGPRSVVEAALEHGDPTLLQEHYDRLRELGRQPAAGELYRRP